MDKRELVYVGGGILQRPLTRLLAEDVDLRLDTSGCYRLLISVNRC